MVIHSSSLTFSRVGFNRPEGDKVEIAQKKEESNELSVSEESYNRQFNQALAPVSSPDEIKQKLENAGLDTTMTNTESRYKPTDVRTLKALISYTDAINQPLRDQRSDLIAGIDIYA